MYSVCIVVGKSTTSYATHRKSVIAVDVMVSTLVITEALFLVILFLLLTGAESATETKALLLPLRLQIIPS